MQAIVQLRGDVNMDGDVEDTLSMLNVHAVNHCTFVPESDAYRGMITKVNDYVAHGEPSEDVVELLLSRRAESIEGDADIDEEWLAEHTDYEDFASLANAIVNEETTLREQGLSPTLRLHPPRSGHRGIKQPIATGGNLGKHETADIDDLLEAMR